MRPVRLDMDGFAAVPRRGRPSTSPTPTTSPWSAPTGSGKSTVIDAMTFALYGTVPRWNDRSMVMYALAPTANRGTVRLVFDVDDGRYVVARELRRTKAGVHVRNARLERLHRPDRAGRDRRRRPSRSRPTAVSPPRWRSCSACPSSTSASVWCCRRASSPSSCAPSRRSAADPAPAARRRPLQRHRATGQRAGRPGRATGGAARRAARRLGRRHGGCGNPRRAT